MNPRKILLESNGLTWPSQKAAPKTSVGGAMADQVDYSRVARSCNLWRNFEDISSSWESILRIIDYYDRHQDEHIPTHGPGHWHDPDMLVIGNPGITVNMAIAQMTIWSIWSAPLIMSNDLRTIGPEFRYILLNRDVIDIDQDPMGRMGRLVAKVSRCHK
ncbi:hypothetical protein OESDEN_05392 [Oesophagostomum dentatum]|uniref:Alpha-galactosidase n=1 Tax=Oesophagostomum dentatum TaxID=61180 RepID=A0A0B1TH23_OESDE|nr:hypothetical protein OESDEN_05392 [Oesophagostomum dentatum]